MVHLPGPGMKAVSSADAPWTAHARAEDPCRNWARASVWLLMETIMRGGPILNRIERIMMQGLVLRASAYGLEPLEHRHGPDLAVAAAVDPALYRGARGTAG